MQNIWTQRSLSTAEYKVPCCSFRLFSYEPLAYYCMSVPWWWEVVQFTSQKCDSVCTDWMNVVDCIVLSGAHLLAVTSLSDSPTASTQRGCETLPVVWTVPHSAQCIPTYCMCGCTFTAHAVCPAHLWDSTFWLLYVDDWVLDGLLAQVSH